ncbi:hypothetical protein TGME49_215520 [Toxoplasma gondii ME49]|uniref:Transmembrane protein n=2 Tax=Toxoplasma gondii TaxID=5811 RepID=A0A086JVF4_TOXGO|nr:hypothetical protein TGME49_215520 [Toxoplasma gondii ME49]EPT26439.1 hypothetical protein TGME49_215520 [Toxoplasma gondii ME49]KFG36122.1 hypothetical protein TGDOM2_215520 [Toxoplasma gondii GAB2-2007-GAL-DOM2]|eukprot:XP_002370871.1 hypothetical protein TGME49_215520 [Toxoplasma gondii ME49]
MPALGGGSLIALTALGPVLLKTSLPAGGAAAASTVTGAAPVSLAAGAAGTAVAGGGKAAGAVFLSKGAVTALKGSGSFLSKATGAAASAPSSLTATTGEAAHIASHGAHFAHVAAKNTGGRGFARAAGAGAATSHPVGGSLHPHVSPVSHHPIGTTPQGTSSAQNTHAHVARYRTDTLGNRDIGQRGHVPTRSPHPHGQMRTTDRHLRENSGHVQGQRPTYVPPYGNSHQGNGAPTVPIGNTGTGETAVADPMAGAETEPSAGSREVSMITTIAGLALLRWAVGQVCCAGSRKQGDQAGSVALKPGSRRLAKRVARWRLEEEVVVVLKDEDHVVGTGTAKDRDTNMVPVSVTENAGHLPAINVHGAGKIDKAPCSYKTLSKGDVGRSKEEMTDSVDGVLSHLESETTASAGGEDDAEKDRQNSGHEEGILGTPEIPETHVSSATAHRFTYIRRRRGRMANFL